MTAPEMSPLVIRLVEDVAKSKAMLDGVLVAIERGEAATRKLEDRLADLDRRMTAIESRRDERTQQAAESRTRRDLILAAIVGAIAGAIASPLAGALTRWFTRP